MSDKNRCEACPYNQMVTEFSQAVDKTSRAVRNSMLEIMGYNGDFENLATAAVQDEPYLQTRAEDLDQATKDALQLAECLDVNSDTVTRYFEQTADCQGPITLISSVLCPALEAYDDFHASVVPKDAQ